ncbi:MAG: tail fiber domain-containing protein [Saprospiraceae bacterium]
MQRSLLFLTFLFISQYSFAQLHLDVHGDAQIKGKISVDLPSNSVYIGKFAGDNATTGSNQNVFVGQAAGTQNTNGRDNVFIGRASGTSNSTGGENTFIGKEAGRSATTSGNTFMGFEAGYTNTGGSNNVYLGHTSGRENNGSRNVIIGYEAGLDMGSPTDEVVIGYRAGANATRVVTNTGVMIGKQAGEDSQRADVFIGHKAGEVNEGASNIFIGETAGQKNSTGASNVIIGSDAGRNNTIGRVNVFIGQNSGAANSEGVENTFIGANSGEDNSTARGGTFIGYRAGKDNTTAEDNTFIGDSTGVKTTIGRWNTFIGSTAGANNLDGRFNTFIGKNAGLSSATSDNNTCVGVDAGMLMTSDRNTLIGKDAGAKLSTGGINTFVGEDAGQNTTQGSGNAFMGENAGTNNLTGNNNTAIGEDTDFSGTAPSNQTVIGNGTIGTTNNAVRLGNNSVVAVCGAVSYTTCSDERFKTNVKENVAGLDFINKLRPVTYRYDVKGMNQHQRKGLLSADRDIDPTEEASIRNKEKRFYTGFLAQEVETAAKESNFQFSAVHQPENDNDMYGLAYAEFVVPLVKATQEQQQIIENLEAENTALQARLERIEQLLFDNESLSAPNSTLPNQTVELAPVATLSQNQPNPFSENTTIFFNLPVSTQQADIQWINQKGEVLQTTNIVQRGAGQITLKASQLPAGVYQYSLVADGKVVATKQMIVIK